MLTFKSRDRTAWNVLLTLYRSGFRLKVVLFKLRYFGFKLKNDSSQARYDKDSAVNVLSEIGFGIGDLQVDGAKIGMDYVFPPKMKVTMTVDYDDPRKQITFDWFKSAVMCKAQPWICQNPNKITSTS